MISIPSFAPSASRPHDKVAKREQNPHYTNYNGLTGIVAPDRHAMMTGSGQDAAAHAGSGVQHGAAGAVLIFRRKGDPDLVTVCVLVSQLPAERGGEEVVLAALGVLVATPVGGGSYRLTEDAESFGIGQFILGKLQVHVAEFLIWVEPGLRFIAVAEHCVADLPGQPTVEKAHRADGVGVVVPGARVPGNCGPCVWVAFRKPADPVPVVPAHGSRPPGSR